LGKATYLADLYQKSVEILTQNRTEWMGLLSSVSKYYKLSFDKNVLIYVQRPDAGLLATKMGWEKQTGRYLKAGCKGIGVVDMDNPKATLTYYFDLADTRGSYDGFRAAMNAVWELERQYQPEIMHRFHIQFRTDTTSIENCLCQLVQMQGKAYMAKYNPKLEVKDENSVL
jgi:small nuclear ribonucleoprotein (snRNP)-like protein